MNPDIVHDDYTDMLETWTACRDAAIGQRAIHKAGDTYLPKLAGQESKDYNAYKGRAQFYGATGRSIKGMKGLVFRIKPVLEVPKGMVEWVEDITLDGKTLNGLAECCLGETLTVARGGLLVDHPKGAQTENPVTVAAARQLGLRPYITLYKAESIRYWKRERVQNVTKLTYLVLAETFDTDEGQEEQLRVLRLDQGVYTQEVYRKSKDEWDLYDVITPVMNGSPIDEIPFFFLSPEETGCDVQSPPIEDLVNVNISHYKNSADLEHGAHMSGLPTPYITGIDDESPVMLGSATILKIPNPESQVGFMQVGAEGFASIEKLMDRKEQQMAALGARLIAPEKKQVEATETHQIRRGAENSVLASIVGNVERQIVKALEFMALWGGYETEIRYELNKDYIPNPMSPAMLKELTAAWQSGAISEQAYFEALQAGEMYGDSVNFEDERERKAETPPALGNLDDTE